MKRKRKYNHSPLARFHIRLAAKKQWNIDELAQAIQVEAFNAQMSKGVDNARKVTEEYIKEMLYGSRSMSNRWRVALAKVLGISFNDYERQFEKYASGVDVINSDPVFPIDFWPHFEWITPCSPPRKIAARLYGLSKSGISPSFAVIPGQWQPPPGIEEYSRLRNEAWQELVENYSRMKKEAPNPKTAWHVHMITAASDSAVALKISQCDYRDILVTATRQGLEHTIETSLGSHCTVRQWLASSWKPGRYSDPVLPGSRHIVVNIMVLTREGSVVLSRQGPDSPESAGSWATSVSSIVNPKIDCDSDDRPNLARAASRGCKEELNMNTDGTTVQWLTMAAGLKYGSHTFFGVLESQWSEQELKLAVAKNVGRAARDRTHVCQVVEIEFLKLSSESVEQRLKSHDYRPYLELGLALLLWRKDEARIIEGIQKPFSKSE